MTLRITTWNVNGIRNPFGFHPWSNQKTFKSMFDTLEADIVCFQETKIQQKDLTDDMVLVPGWDSYFTFPKHKKGYSGVAIYTRNSKCHPIKAEEGITGILEPPFQPGRSYKSLASSECIGGYPELSKEDALLLDSEGRAIILDFGGFVLIGAYCPVGVDPSRDSFRIAFFETLCGRVRKLVTEFKRRVVVVGDLNISRDEIDAAGAEQTMREMGLSNWKNTPTRSALDQLLEPCPDGVMIDLCRDYFPQRRGMYTCWDVKKNKRPGNAGSRIDYILCSSNMRCWFSEANIQEGLMGSDHCPVFAVIKPTVNFDGVDKKLLDVINPDGSFQDGQQQESLSSLQKPRLCMKRFPEFSQRRNIKDMFNRLSSGGLHPGTSVAFGASQITQVGEITSPIVSTTPSAKRVKISSHTPRPSSRRKPKPQSEGQVTLQGYFKAATSKTDTPSNISKTPEAQSGPPEEETVPNTQPPHDSEISSPDTTLLRDNLIDPIESKDKWSKLFSKRPPPVCDGHNEECIRFTTKKPGPNCGRAFWVCQRPIGPDGESVVKSGRKSEWKCNYFKWASDHN